MLKNYLSLLFVIITVLSIQGQTLLSPSGSFSHKKTSYVTLTDGTEIKGTVEDIDRKKGLIKLIKIKDGADVKHKLKPDQVKEMYLMPSGLDKYSKAMDLATDAQKWNDEKLNQDFLHQGYVYFVTTPVKIKKKAQPMLMQLLNPSFSNKVKIYHDPFAKESTSLGVGGIKVAGGHAKSYFIQVGDDEAAYKVEKKKYKKEFALLWKKCSSMTTEYPDVNWSDLTQHALHYSTCEN